MMQQINHSRGAGKRIARILITVLIFLFSAVVGMLGGEWGQASAQGTGTIPPLPPTSTPTPTTQASTGVPSSTPTATFMIVPSPTTTPSQTATAAGPTETAVPSDEASGESAFPATEEPTPFGSPAPTATSQAQGQASPANEQWWQSPWTLAIGGLLLLTIIGLIRGRKGVRDRSKGG